MEPGIVKSNLRNFYDLEAGDRAGREKQAWKVKARDSFYDLLAREKKKTLLELGAGTGQDSCFFVNRGLEVTAIDLSGEMVKKCRDKHIDAYEMDFYNLMELNKQFDCVWAMNSLLHVPKADLLQVLQGIDWVLNADGLFYMGIYGGNDSEGEYVNDFSAIPRFFSSYSADSIKKLLKDVFEIISFEQIRGNEIGNKMDFQSIIMTKRQPKVV